MTFVGVNGVGKSTNLSKVCFWLLQNGYRVLIAACDTFRSGAVEQLRVHVRNLGALADDLGEGEKRIALFDRGYGKDASGIAKEAISYGMSLVTSGAVVVSRSDKPGNRIRQTLPILSRRRQSPDLCDSC